PWLPDSRLARQGTQEGRPQEGPQAAAVQQALTPDMAERRLSGTDRVRGRAGEVLTASLALGLGPAAVAELGPSRPPVLRDTRRSGPMLEAALAAGASSAGASVLLGGVLPTPAAPLLTVAHGFDLAAVISASHNPYADNGIK